MLIAGTGVYSSVALHTVQKTLEGLEPGMMRYMGTTLESKWDSGGVTRRLNTTKGDCSPGPACTSETDSEHAVRHKAAFAAAVAEFPVD